MTKSNFERIIGAALSDEGFAEALEAAATRLKQGEPGAKKAFQDAVKGKLDIELGDGEVDMMLLAIEDIDFEAIIKVARAFGDEKAF